MSGIYIHVRKETPRDPYLQGNIAEVFTLVPRSEKLGSKTPLDGLTSDLGLDPSLKIGFSN
jgi:hypothetical protein